MSVITLFLREHKGEDRLFMEFPYHKKINDSIRLIPSIKWSRTYKQWHLPAEKNSIAALRQKIQSLARVDTSFLKEQVQDAREAKAGRVSPTLQHRESVYEKPARPSTPRTTIQPVNAHVLPAMQQRLVLKSYSSSTVRTYLNEMSQLLQTIGNFPADQLTPDHLKRYLVYCFEKLHLRENTLHSRINALKFYYEQVLGREKFFWEIPRPKKQFLLPKVFNEKELQRMFAAAANLKHKALLFTAYSAGLRVSEVVNLKLTDIDSERMQIRIRNSKGKKDRYVGLSILLLDVLRAYLTKVKPRPLKYLFEGDNPGEPYSSRSAQLVFHQAKEKAGIRKEVSFHSLRHSFATHLLEKGVDIKYIKELLGHFSIKTTEVYLHVKKEDLITIVNPLDELYKGKSWDA